MGRNLEALFTRLSEMDDDGGSRGASGPYDVARPSGRSSERFHYFRQGTCIVHHMFGEDVARQVREEYRDAFVTAHLEVPGEMFEVALARQANG